MLLHDEHELETYKRKAAWLPISLTKKSVNLNLKKSIIFPHFSCLNISVENKNNYLHDLWLLYHLTKKLKVFSQRCLFSDVFHDAILMVFEVDTEKKTIA